MARVPYISLSSTAWSVRKLGGKRWQTLHRLIYFSVIAGVIHYKWLVKADATKPLELVLTVLLLYRAAVWMQGKKARSKNAVMSET